MRRGIAVVLFILGVLTLLFGTQSAPARRTHVEVTSLDTSAFPMVVVRIERVPAPLDVYPTPHGTHLTIREAGVEHSVGPLMPTASRLTALHSVLIVDTSPSMATSGRLAAAQAAAKAYVAQLRPGDKVAIISFASQVDVKRRFDDRQDRINAAIDALQPGGGSAVYDALAGGLDLLRDIPTPRAIVLLSDGQDCSERNDASCPSSYGSRTSRNDAIAIARQDGQRITLLNPAQTPPNDALLDVVKRTGGSVIDVNGAEQISQLYADLTQSPRGLYAVTYQSRASRPPLLADVQLEMVQPQPSGSQWPLAASLIVLGLTLAIWPVARNTKPGVPTSQNIPAGATVRLNRNVRRCSACDAVLEAESQYCDQCGRVVA